jgi:DNA-binding XRE family transcriptional regulator
VRRRGCWVVRRKGRWTGLTPCRTPADVPVLEFLMHQAELCGTAIKTCYETMLLTSWSLLIYRSFMTNGGRPIERPAHLTPEQRHQAQQRTRKWREDCGLSQQRMAKEITVSYATYRAWENSKDRYAGPTLIQADLLNRALLRLLGGRYEDGQAFDVWGWPREQDMGYQQVVDLLRAAGFSVPRLQASGRPPANVLWVHKVREPTLVHAVFSLAAAAATRAGLPVHLLLDDFDLSSNRRRQECDEFESKIREWVTFASGVDAKLTTGFYSTILTDEYLARRGWSAVTAYLNRECNVLEFLRASKAVSPLQYDIDAEESVLALLEGHDHIKADQLLTPLRNWLVFEAEVARMIEVSPVNAAETVITLGGEDERILWEMWHRGCIDDLSARVQHVFLKPMPTPRRQTWEEPALVARTATKDGLTAYLTRRTTADGHTDLVEWLLRSAVRFPAALNPGFRDGLDHILAQINLPLQASGPELSRVMRAVASAVVGWFSV